MSDLEKLEAALVSRIYDDFIGGTDIRAVVVDENIFYIIQKAARAHLQSLKSGVDERACTCHPDEAPKPCQKKYALRDCTKNQSALDWFEDMLKTCKVELGLGFSSKDYEAEDTIRAALSTPPVDGDTKAELKIAKDFSCDGDKIRAARDCLDLASKAFMRNEFIESNNHAVDAYRLLDAALGNSASGNQTKATKDH